VLLAAGTERYRQCSYAPLRSTGITVKGSPGDPRLIHSGFRNEPGKHHSPFTTRNVIRIHRIDCV
jgi:hypothetical protein